ncbi:molybdate ABC transporter substrate-binding protein [Campylobacter majalis]|uniref:molybdate ABC transporter substrate-binding protein n=1 Tax=Campylobacter majalis TaxID=2790656 RepID=UPI003D68D6F6
MKKILTMLALCVVMAVGGEVVVFAAANTTYAFNELIQKYSQIAPQTKIKLSLGASGGLVTQIQNGAPADVFMAANMDFAHKLYESGFALKAPVVYAQGALAIFSIRDIKLNANLKGLEATKSLSIANPDIAPYGKASIEALKNANEYDKLKDKIIITQKISETLSQALSAADVGFIAASAMYDEKMSKYKEGENFVLVDQSLYTPIDQGIVLTKKGESNQEAKAFYEFILSDDAKEIFKKYGYNTPK